MIIAHSSSGDCCATFKASVSCFDWDPTPHYRTMERRTQFNIGYLLFALVAIFTLQQWWQQAQRIEVLPYSEFEKLMAEHKIDEVVISDQRITGKFKSKEGSKTIAVANLVPP